MSKIQVSLAMLLCVMPFSSLGAQTKAPNHTTKSQTSDAIQHVATNGNNLNDGHSWGSAKATLEAARTALPPTGGDILFAPVVTTRPPAYSSFNSMQLKNFTNLSGTTFAMTRSATGQWFLNTELRTLSGNPAVVGRTTLYHYPMLIGKAVMLDTSRDAGDLSTVQALQDVVLAVHDNAPSFGGTLWGEEIDADLSADTTIDHILGLDVYVGPYASNGSPSSFNASIRNLSTGVRSSCENNGVGRIAVCRSFVAGAEVNGAPGATWGGWWGFDAEGPEGAGDGTFDGNIYNFLSKLPKKIPEFSSPRYHYFGLTLVGGSNPFTNDIWFWGGGWNSGHFLFGGASNPNVADHVWWAGGKYGWETKEGGPPTSPTDFTYSTAMINSKTDTLVMPRGRGGDPAISTDGALTLNPGELDLSPRGHGIIVGNNSHLQQSGANGDLAGQMVLKSGRASRKFVHPFAHPPVCVSTDTTAVNAVRVVTSTTTLTLIGTEGDVVNYICMGNPN